MSGMWPSSFASTRPMIQVKRVSGQARCSVRTTGSTWQVSPMADRRRMQTLAGGVSKRLDIEMPHTRGERLELLYMLAIQEGLLRIAAGGILYDASRLRKPGAELFDVEHWRAQGRCRRSRAGVRRSRSSARARNAGCCGTIGAAAGLPAFPATGTSGSARRDALVRGVAPAR